MEYEVEKQPKPMYTTKPSLEPSSMILIISIEADLFTVSQIIELKNEWKCSDMIAKRCVHRWDGCMKNNNAIQPTSS